MITENFVLNEADFYEFQKFCKQKGFDLCYFGPEIFGSEKYFKSYPFITPQIIKLYGHGSNSKGVPYDVALQQEEKWTLVFPQLRAEFLAKKIVELNKKSAETDESVEAPLLDNMSSLKKKSDKKKNKWKLVLATVICLLFWVIISWDEYKAGQFHLWYAWVWLGAIALLLLANSVPSVGQKLARVIKPIDFEKEPIEGHDNIRREYLMAQVPLFFIASGLIMQSSFRNGHANVLTVVVGILMFCYAIYLVYISFKRNVSKIWSYNTYVVTSSMSIIGIAVFGYDLINEYSNLSRASVYSWYTNAFLFVGLGMLFCIAAFYIVSLSRRNPQQQ
jgi:hypothetical protein